MKRLLFFGLLMALFVATTSSPPCAYAQKPSDTYISTEGKKVLLASLTENTGVATAMSPTPVVAAAPIDGQKTWFNSLALPEKDPTGFMGLGWPYIWAWIIGLVSLFYYIYPTAEKWKWLTWILNVFQFIGPPNLNKEGGTHGVNMWFEIIQLFKKK